MLCLYSPVQSLKVQNLKVHFSIRVLFYLSYIRNELHFISGYWQITDDGVLWCRALVSRYVLPTQM